MRYHLSGNIGQFQVDALLKAKVKNVLFSYAGLSGTHDSTAKRLTLFADANIILDSGAFSTWNTGKHIDREELLAFYKIARHYNPDIHLISLDEIPGERGRKPTKEEATAACKQGLDNYLYYKKQGIDTIPVFHEDDDWKYLEIYKQETDYIAISPANDSNIQRRIDWLDYVFRNLKADYKTHGLAATSDRLLKRYPFYSVDSVNWLSVALYGNSKTIDHPYVRQMISNHETRVDLLIRDIRYYQDIEKNITNLWKKRGVVWED